MTNTVDSSLLQQACENAATSLSPLYTKRDLEKMSEDIDKHVLRKYEICQKLGKGVSCPPYPAL